MVLEKILENPLDNKKIKPVHPKGNQSWIFIGRTDAEAEAPILWPPDGKIRLIGKKKKNVMPGKIKGRRKRGWRRTKMVGWHQRTWVWISSGSWSWTGRPGVLQSMGSQRVGHNWATELSWTVMGGWVFLGGSRNGTVWLGFLQTNKWSYNFTGGQMGMYVVVVVVQLPSRVQLLWPHEL